MSRCCEVLVCGDENLLDSICCTQLKNSSTIVSLSLCCRSMRSSAARVEGKERIKREDEMHENFMCEIQQHRLRIFSPPFLTSMRSHHVHITFYHQKMVHANEKRKVIQRLDLINFKEIPFSIFFVSLAREIL